MFVGFVVESILVVGIEIGVDVALHAGIVVALIGTVGITVGFEVHSSSMILSRIFTRSSYEIFLADRTSNYQGQSWVAQRQSYQPTSLDA